MPISRTKLVGSGAAVLAIAVALLLFYCFQRDDLSSLDQSIGATPFSAAPVGPQAPTVVTPHMDHQIAAGTNVLWCSTFQLAWNELRLLAGGDIRLKPGHPMVAALNKGTACREDVDSASCTAMAGVVGDGVLGRIAKEVTAKFKGRIATKLLPPAGTLPQGWWVTYACLLKDLFVGRGTD